jgi:GMP synthase (glutamine-hydrolysing)
MANVLLIGHDPNETFGVAASTLSASGMNVLQHRATSDGALPAVDDVAGVIVFGGAMNVDMTDEHPYLAEERDFVRAAVGNGIPFLGICLGAQMLARALEGRVYPAGIRELGFNALRPTPEASDDPLLSVFADGDMVFHWHEDTFELPHGAVLLARGDDVHMQAFRMGEKAWGMQFHLEVDRPELELWLKAAGEDVVRAWGSTSEQLIDQADRHLDPQEAKAREVFRRFADVVRTSV